MALGEITKQLAQQALSSQVKDLLDPPKPAPSAPPDNVVSAIVGQIQAMQKALKEDQELVVQFHSTAEILRIVEIYVPSWHLFVLTGIDSNRNLTRVISPVHSTQLTCKVMKIQPGSTPARINFILPK